MKKWIPIIVIIGIVILAGAYMASLNNRLVTLDESVNAQWGNVRTDYGRFWH